MKQKLSLVAFFLFFTLSVSAQVLEQAVATVSALPATCIATGAANSSAPVRYQGQIYYCSAANTWTAGLGGGGGGGTPGGSSGDFQINNAGSFGGATGVAYSPSGATLTVTGRQAAQFTSVFQSSASASVAALVAKLGSGATGALFEGQDSAGAVLARLDASGNLSLGNIAAGTNGVSVLAIKNGTIPASSPADGVQIYAQDVSSSSELFVRNEAGVITRLSSQTVELGFALSDEATAITTGTAKLTVRMPYGMTLTAVRASVGTVSSSGVVTVDINEEGATVLSTKLTIDANEKTSTTAAAPVVISDTALADDAEITFDIDTAGTGAKGLKVWLIGRKN